MAIQTLNTIKKWFKTGLKPTQDQFWDTWDSFRHKFEQIPLKDIEELETTLDAKAEKSQLEEHQNNPNAHAELFSAKENKSEKGMAGGYVPLNEFSKITHQYLDVVNNLTTGGENALLSAEQGFILQNQIDIINTLLSSDNIDLDTIQKIVDVVEQIQMSLNNILVNDLTTGGVTKALTAEMGKQLNKIKLTGAIATNAEMQITETVPEDNKIVSRLKLFNWFEWLKGLHLKWNNTISAKPGVEPDDLVTKSQLDNSIPSIDKVLETGNRAKDKTFFFTDFFNRDYLALTYFGFTIGDANGNGILQANQYDGLFFNINKSDQCGTMLKEEKATQLNELTLPNKSGKLAIVNDYIITAPGTIKTPALIIPKGDLTIVPQNGAIERDSSGQLWETHNGIRSLIGSKPASEMSSGTVQLATDEETQIDTAVTEDNKVVSRSKLFNWWENIKTKTQTISATWNFSKGLKVNDTVSGNTTEMLQDMFVAQLDRQDNGINKTEYRGETIKWITSDGWSTLLKPITPNQNRTLTLPNKSGTIAISNDYVKTASGTASTPALIIPNGVLTTVPQNGAIERDENGILWETHNGVRNRIVTTDYVNSIYNSGTYTPSLENALNITGATLISATYTKIDNIVNVMIALTATPVSFSDAQINISLPFNRNTSTSLLSGIATGSTANSNFSAQVSVINTSKAAIIYKASTSGVSNITANFSYSIN